MGRNKPSCERGWREGCGIARKIAFTKYKMLLVHARSPLLICIAQNTQIYLKATLLHLGAKAKILVFLPKSHLLSKYNTVPVYARQEEYPFGLKPPLIELSK